MIISSFQRTCVSQIILCSSLQPKASRSNISSSVSSHHKKPFRPAHEVEGQVTHSMPPHKIEIFKSLENWADNNLLTLLKPVESAWQPQDFLPDPSSCDQSFYEQTEELRKRAKEIPDDYYVCLVGDMITEEALPTYQTMLNTFDGVRDETGASLSPWAIWTRAWTAEENRHGDLLKQYLYLSGRVDMRPIEKTIQYLIGCGMQLYTVRSEIRSKHACPPYKLRNPTTCSRHPRLPSLSRIGLASVSQPFEDAPPSAPPTTPHSSNSSFSSNSSTSGISSSLRSSAPTSATHAVQRNERNILKNPYGICIEGSMTTIGTDL